MGLLNIVHAMQANHTISLCPWLLTAHTTVARFDCAYRIIVTVYSTYKRMI